MRIAIIFNPASGTAADEVTLKSLLGAFAQTTRFFSMELGGEDVKNTVRAYRPERIIASGGDGTINFSASLAIELKAELAALPTGTFNHFTKDLGIPQDVAGAMDVALLGTVRNLDYATVNGNVFVNSSSIGAYPAAVLTREDLRPRFSKMVAMSLAIVKVAFKNRTLSLELRFPDKTLSLKTPSVFVGNNVYDLGGLGVPSRSRLHEGTLSVHIVKAGRYREMLITAVAFLIGRHHPKLKYHETAGPLTIDSPRKAIHVSVDGEILHESLPLTYELHRGGLKVVTPPDYPAS